jgi:hypothetical protein
LRLDSFTGEITGLISDGTWTAELLADRAFSRSANPATNYVGVYTLSIPGNHDTTAEYVGDGFMTVTIDFSGTIHMGGELSDGTHFSQGSHISKNGQWPFYIPLYGRKGALLSWITFSNFPATDLGGDLIWFKPASGKNKYFPAGLTNQTSAIGSSFLPPIPFRGHQQLSFTNAVLTLDGGNLSGTITNFLANSGTATSTNRIILKWDNVSGLVRGSFIHPTTGKTASLHGVLLGNQASARGYLLGTNQSGSFTLRQQLVP